ncbi:MAG: hypothetical protein RI885_2528 [Actinomycetota bacterium]|jgi:hypothetical protein
MWIRRAFYWIQLAAIVALPVWIVVAIAMSPRSLGAQDLLALLSWPALAVAMLVVTGLTWARRAVRSTRTLSWMDVASVGTWITVAAVYGAFIAGSSALGSGLTGGLLVLVSIAAFWVAIWQLVRAARQRVETVMAQFDRATVRVDSVSAGEYTSTREARGDGDILTIHPPKH